MTREAAIQNAADEIKRQLERLRELHPDAPFGMLALLIRVELGLD